MMKKRHLEILGYHVLQVGRKTMLYSDSEIVECGFANNAVFYTDSSL